MKQLLQILLRYLLVFLLVTLAMEQAMSQTGGVVHAGETTELSVIDMEGHSYYWELYCDVEGVNFANTSGNCLPGSAYFIGGNAGPTVTVMWSTPGLYFFKVTAYNAGGCSNLKVGKMQVLQPLPTAEFVDVSPICFGEIATVTVLLTGTPPFAITYTDGIDTIRVDNITDHSTDLLLTPLVTTNYWITNVEDTHGYPNSELVGPAVVIVFPLPQIISLNITDAVDGHPNGAVEVIASTSALPLAYSVDGENWQDTPFITGLLPGNYIIWIQDANGCVAKTPFIIRNIITGEIELIAGALTQCAYSIAEIPVMAYGFENVIGFTLELAFDENILEFIHISHVNPALITGLTSSYGEEAGYLLISFESSVPITIPPGESLFYVDFMGVGAGSSLIEWQLPQCIFLAAGEYPIPSIYTHGEVDIKSSPKLLVFGEGSYCEGELLTLVAELQDSQNVSFTWQGPNGVSHNGSIWPLGNLGLRHSGTYTLVAANSFGCDTIVEISVLVNPIPEVSFNLGDIVCIDEPIWLEPGIGYTAYLWQDGSTQARFYAVGDGHYWVEVTDENGCTNIASVTLIPCDIELLIPSAFTPNGDGLNDEFGPIVPNVELENYRMLIYNKWGQLIFQTNDISKGWDGTINGQVSQMDVYSYIIIYELPSHFTDRTPRQLHGSVMLLR